MNKSVIKIFQQSVITIFLFITTVSLLSAEEAHDKSPINFSITVSAESLRVGDEFIIVIKADYPEEIKLSEPAAKAAEGAFVLKSEPQLKSKVRNGRKYDEYTFTLSVFDTGELETPSFEFFWYDREGNQQAVVSPSGKIYIRSVLPTDTTGIDIKDIIGPKPLPTRWWMYILIALAVLAVGSVIYWLYKRRVKAVEIPETPPEPPYDIAIRRLIQLKDENLPGKGKIKLYYSELSEIIRQYIQGRFDIVAVEATTYELKKRLKHSELPNEKSVTALEILNRSDMVKFAKHIPDSGVYGEDYELIKDVVVSTKPIEQPVNEQNSLSVKKAEVSE